MNHDVQSRTMGLLHARLSESDMKKVHVVMDRIDSNEVRSAVLELLNTIACRLPENNLNPSGELSDASGLSWMRVRSMIRKV
jgi:hypothetical protein